MSTKEYIARPPNAEKKKKIPCLKCDKGFSSPDPTRIRICDNCKAGTAWRGSQQSDFRLPPQNAIPQMPGSGALGVRKKRLVRGGPGRRRRGVKNPPPLKNIRVNKSKKGTS